VAIVRIRQWAFDRQALKTAKTTDYQRTGWTQRNSRSADAPIQFRPGRRASHKKTTFVSLTLRGITLLFAKMEGEL
jgi:hypothetical protein